MQPKTFKLTQHQCAKIHELERVESKWHIQYLLKNMWQMHIQYIKKEINKHVAEDDT